MLAQLQQLQAKLRLALRDRRCGHCQRQTPAEGYGGLFCQGCQQQLGVRRPRPVLKNGALEIHAATQSTPAMKHLLYAYKFSRKRALGGVLSDLLIAYWRELIDQHPSHGHARLVVTTPPVRERSGLEIAERLPVCVVAKLFAHSVGIPFDDRVFCWQRETVPQHQLTVRAERLANLKEALAVRPEALAKYVEGHAQRTGKESLPTLLVVDDLTTTGATLSEAARAWKSAWKSAWQNDWQAGNLTEQPKPRVWGLAICHVPLAAAAY